MISQGQHKIHRLQIRIYLLALTVTTCFLIVGCIGGGGRIGDGGIVYSGQTTPAVITQDNAVAISASSLQYGSSADGLIKINRSNPFNSGGAKADAKTQAENNARTITAEGLCGGIAAYSIQLNEENGNFSGGLSLKSYCGGDTTLNGDASIVGILDKMSGAFTSSAMIFNSLSATSSSESYDMSGKIKYQQSGMSAKVTMDMAIRDNNKSDYVCLVENYQSDLGMNLAGGGMSLELYISGRFYDPEYGYVDLDTPTVLVIQPGAEYPSSGVGTLKGGPGAAGGPTIAKITVLSNTQCKVEADTNGDGTYDYDSGVMMWSDFDSSDS